MLTRTARERALPLGLLLLALAQAAGAREPQRARLTYLREPGAELCPDEESFQQAVAGRLGYWPFADDAELVLHARFSRLEGRARASLRMERPSGNPLGEREIEAPAESCAELASALELAASIAIDPHVLTRQPASPVEPAPPLPAPPPAEPAAPPEEPLRWRASAGVAVAAGIAPAPAVGLSAGALAQRRSLSLGLEARVDLPASGRWGEGQVETSVLQLGALGCLHLSRFAGCLVASGGALSAAGRGYPLSRRAVAPYGAAGARVVAELPVSGPVSFRLSAEAQAPILRPILQVGGQEVWAVSSLIASLGAAAVVHFP